MTAGSPPVRPRVLVTRPQPQADEWVARLEALGQPAMALPLLAIEPLPPTDVQLRAAWARLAQRRLVMFVSPNAVSSFMAARPPGWAWPDTLLAGATGPGTVAALTAAGVPTLRIAAPRVDAAQFDAETLWNDRLQQEDWCGMTVLIVRASEGRDWLARTLAAQGADVEMLAAYRRCAPRWTDQQRAALQGLLQLAADHAPVDGHAIAGAAAALPPAVWLFSSSEAIQQLPALWTQQGPAATACGLAAPGDGLPAALRCWPGLATHPRIADTARAAGFGQVMQIQPDPEIVVQAVDRLVEAARAVRPVGTELHSGTAGPAG